ncbi:hypothetical protein OG756_15140 [Streptomyces sp. NBC_01310]|uniref:hypothetical protein n=1 Tax=Streptomyces sp. NBC_01310 TaxID=2903820 RepID=UPI0035B69ECC|nr:hypothetical protein OG756_15140 [Streptomyces sp. NBC_01310]
MIESTDGEGVAEPSETTPDLQALIGAWQDVQDDVRSHGNPEYDETVLDCVRRLVADPGGDRAPLWVLGLAMTLPYADRRPERVSGAVHDALDRADRALRNRPCTHAEHPYEDGLDDPPHYLEDVARRLAHGDTDFSAIGWTGEQWACPRNIAGLARVGMDRLEPGSAADVPARLSEDAQDTLDRLNSVLEGYGFDAYNEIADAGSELRFVTSDGDRAGGVLVATAASWYALSGVVRERWVLDDLIETLEKVPLDALDHPCAHGDDGHPGLPGFLDDDDEPDRPAIADDTLTLGVHLGDDGGRALLEQAGIDLSLWLCPRLTAATARKTLSELREGREELFGHRETGHLDTEFLRADGTLAIEPFTALFDGRDESARELQGIWAARRHAHAADDRERTVLVLTAATALRITHPGPAIALARDIRTLLRTVAETPHPHTCAHDDHPALERLDGSVLRHLHAPETVPAPRPDAEAFGCPAHLAALAAAGVRDVDGWCGEED